MIGKVSSKRLHEKWSSSINIYFVNVGKYTVYLLLLKRSLMKICSIQCQLFIIYLFK